MFGESYHEMPLYRLIKLMLVAPVDFFSGRKLYGCNVIARVRVFCFCFDVFYHMDVWSARQIKFSVKLLYWADAENCRRPSYINIKKINEFNAGM